MKSVCAAAMIVAFGVPWLGGCREPPSHGTRAEREHDRPVLAIDKADMDLTVSPGQDFYRYVNGNWLRHNPIPPGYDAWGSFPALRAQNAKILHDILEAASRERSAVPGSPTQLLRDFYLAAMDTTAIERDGKAPLDPYFRMIDSMQTVDDLAAVIGELHRSAAPQALFLFYRDVDAEQPQAAIAALAQGGFALPARSYYLDRSSGAVTLRGKYRQHVRNMFRLIGEPDAIAGPNANTVLRLETVIARNSLTPEQTRTPKLTFHKMSLSTLQKLSPRFNWTRYAVALGLPADGDIDVVTPTYFAAMSEMISRVPLADWKVYLKWNTLMTNAPLLSQAFVDENFSFFEKTLNGATELKPRWQRVLAQTESGLGWALAQEYVKRSFSAHAKVEMLVMIQDIRETFRQRISDLDWMSADTKRRALSKLARISVNVGYPDHWPDLSRIRIAPTGYIANVVSINRHQVADDIEKLRRPVDRTDFGMTPQQVNAYYSAQDNKIVFPSGILQPPFFHETFDDAVNYGAIGSVIAHEFTHAFDDHGSQYAEDGMLSDWWTPDDLKKFKAKQRIVIDQYSAYTILDTVHLNGALTVGENIADLGGVGVAFQAFPSRQRKKGRDGDIDGFTPEQRFFIAWAQLWRSNKTPEAIRGQVETSTTSVSPFRVIGPLSNLDGFIAAFGLKEGDRMVRPPGQRVRIW